MQLVKAQGNFRRKPDGWLHVWNFAATQASGLAGAVVNHIVSNELRDVIEQILIQRAMVVEEELAVDEHEYAEIRMYPKHELRQARVELVHGCWRFKKEFLKEHFQIAVYSAMYAAGINVATLAARAIDAEYIKVVTGNKLVADNTKLLVANDTLTN